jgi:hypothetical protein
MLSKELRDKQNKQLMKDQIKELLTKEQGSFLKIQEINTLNDLIQEKLDIPQEDPRFKWLNSDEISLIIKDILDDNPSVQLYQSQQKFINLNEFLDIERDKYQLYMAKLYGLISNKRIEHVFKQMPEKIKKNYVMKKVNREAHNKLVRFAKENNVSK